MSDDNKYLYTAGYTGTKNLYVYENINNVYTPIQTIPQFTHYIQGIEVTKDNQWLVVASEDDYTYVYTLNSSGLYE